MQDILSALRSTFWAIILGLIKASRAKIKCMEKTLEEFQSQVRKCKIYTINIRETKKEVKWKSKWKIR